MILPILFNTEMVRAILDGRKTVTRRMVKPKQLSGVGCMQCPNNLPEEFLRIRESMFTPFCNMPDNELIGTIYKPPYQPGDILYVREAYYEDKNCILYKADNHDLKGYRSEDGEDIVVKWHPSIHMPKEAARIWLKVTNVRAERLSNMKVEDAIAEGISMTGLVTEQGIITYRVWNRWNELWESTVPKKDMERYGMDANPWVWVIEFERCEKPEGWCV